MTRLRSHIRRLRKREDGSATIEFVLTFPLFMLLFLSVFETGLLMTRYMMFERALDIAVREMRLNRTGGAYTHDDIKDIVCAQTVIMANHCDQDLLIEMIRVDATFPEFSFPANTAVCRDRGEDVVPVTTFEPGSRDQLMYVRACISVEPVFYTSGLGATLRTDGGGGFNMIAQSAFAVEPS